MYVRPEQLRSNLEAIDSDSLHAKVQSGRLTKEALPVAIEILKERGFKSEGESPNAPAITALVPDLVPRTVLPGGTVAKVLLGLYIVFVLLCTSLVFLDPPWVKARNGTWEGMAGFMASEASGAPWSILVLLTQMGRLGEAQLVAVNFGCVVLNVVLFLAYIRRT